jgi:hypothetical protein
MVFLFTWVCKFPIKYRNFNELDIKWVHLKNKLQEIYLFIFFFFGKQIPPLCLSMQPYLPSGVLSARYAAQSNRVDFEVVHSQ